MKIRTRMLALVLVLSFLLGLCGCLPVPTVRKGETAPEEELQTSEAGLPAREEAIETLAADGYLTPLAREALSFDEMVLGEISLDEFTPYAQALTRAAEAESREAFHRACVEAERMLVRINTAGALLEIESDRDADRRSAQHARGQSGAGILRRDGFVRPDALRDCLGGSRGDA